MKQIEYIYLGLCIIGIVFLATEFKDMNNLTRILAILGVGIMAFMYAFRRNSRILLEKNWDEEESEEVVEETKEDSSAK
jgi:K+ transporter